MQSIVCRNKAFSRLGLGSGPGLVLHSSIWLGLDLQIADIIGVEMSAMFEVFIG